LWATLSFFVAALFLADWIGNLECLSKTDKKKVRLIQSVFLLVVIGIGWKPVKYYWRVEQAAKLEGDIEAPEGYLHGILPVIELGDSGPKLMWMGKPDTTQFKMAYDAGLRIDQSETGLQVTTPIRDHDGHLVVDINKNHWIVYPPYCADKNYTKNALEVLDSRGHVVLQIVILRDRVQIQGEWFDDTGRGVQLIKAPAPDNGAFFNRENWKSGGTSTELIPPIFLYPSKQHWGEFAKR